MSELINTVKNTIGAIAITVVMALSWHGVTSAQNFIPDTQRVKEVETRDSVSSDGDVTISLITCYPGEEIYELCGHSAVRVRGENIDSVWNYGIFDFNQPNFVYRFVKGETDYRGASYPFRWFMPEYISTGRKVVEQDINFTPQEAREMLRLLRESVTPENAVYRYNYIKDNCSTRIINSMDSAAGEKIIYPDSVRYGTYRNEMRAYHKNYPWYQFGIDVALGSGLEDSIGSREEMYVPLELMRNAASAKFSDGRPFVKATRVLNPGEGDVTLPPTPWGLSPLFWAWLVALGLGCVVVWNFMSGRLYLPVYGAWFFMLGLAGCLVAFLVFVSVHESTSPNVLILWLNPFQFLFVAGMAIRKLKSLAMAMAWYNFVVMAVLLIVYPFIKQSFNPAFFPLMLATSALGATYAILRNKTSYKKR